MSTIEERLHLNWTVDLHRTLGLLNCLLQYKAYDAPLNGRKHEVPLDDRWRAAWIRVTVCFYVEKVNADIERVDGNASKYKKKKNHKLHNVHQQKPRIYKTTSWSTETGQVLQSHHRSLLSSTCPSTCIWDAVVCDSDVTQPHLYWSLSLSVLSRCCTPQRASMGSIVRLGEAGGQAGSVTRLWRQTDRLQLW